MAGAAAGSDGLMIEVHPDPENALSDSAQQLTIPQFQSLYKKVKMIAQINNKNVV
jgi:3-deoxy-7-phosphoheptulonate synthase